MLGRIYKIVHNQSNICYIGSTPRDLRQRWNEHKYQSKHIKSKSIYIYIEKYGIENFTIILLKEYDVIDFKHLKAYEQLWINKLKPINFQSSFQPLKQQAKKQSRIKSNIKNKEKIKEKKKKKYICEKCNIELNYNHKARHEKSKKHILLY